MKHVLSSAFAVIVFAGCLGSDAPSEPPIARFAASERSVADLGVARWEVYSDGADARVIGYDDQSARRAEAIIERDDATADERVRITGVYPERGEVQLTSEGTVEGTEALRPLAVDLHADLGTHARPLPVELPRPPSDGLGTASSELGLSADKSGIYTLGWNLFYHCAAPVLPDVGGTSCRTNHVRHHAEAFAEGGSASSWSWSPSNWVTSSETECKTQFTFCTGGGRWDNFHWSIWSERKNLALRQPAFQSSTAFGGVASRAVDGFTFGEFNGLPPAGIPPSVTHTNFEFQPFWQVDLGGVQNLGTVVLFNRTDCCSDRLADVDVLFSVDGINFSIATQTFGPMSAPSATLSVSGQARFVRVKLRGTNVLSLAEVQLFAP